MNYMEIYNQWCTDAYFDEATKAELLAIKEDTAEIEEAKSAYKILGAKLVGIEKYALPEDYGERSLAIVEKVAKTPNKYPRGQGKERKNPL